MPAALAQTRRLRVGETALAGGPRRRCGSRAGAAVTEPASQEAAPTLPLPTPDKTATRSRSSAQAGSERRRAVASACPCPRLPWGPGPQLAGRPWGSGRLSRWAVGQCPGWACRPSRQQHRAGSRLCLPRDPATLRLCGDSSDAGPRPSRPQGAPARAWRTEQNTSWHYGRHGRQGAREVGARVPGRSSPPATGPVTPTRWLRAQPSLKGAQDMPWGPSHLGARGLEAPLAGVRGVLVPAAASPWGWEEAQWCLTHWACWAQGAWRSVGLSWVLGLGHPE